MLIWLAIHVKSRLHTYGVESLANATMSAIIEETYSKSMTYDFLLMVSSIRGCFT